MERLTLPRLCYRHLLRRAMCSQPTPVPKGETVSSTSVSPTYRPTELQKTLLVWTKKFKSKADVPTFVSPETIDRARNEARIKLSNILMLLTVLGCILMVISGKAAAKRGESIHQINQDFHNQYRSDYEKKQAANSTPNK